MRLTSAERIERSQLIPGWADNAGSGETNTGQRRNGDGDAASDPSRSVGLEARDRTMLTEIAVAGVAVVLAILSVRVVPEDRRLGIVRLGRYAGLRGPGIVVVLPIVERAVAIDLQRDIPAWRSMSPDQLAREAERLSETGRLGI